MHGLTLCGVVESFCSPTHNIVPHISWHDLPCLLTTKKYADFPEQSNFSVAPAEILDSNMVLCCQQNLCSLHIVFEYFPSTHGRGMMLVLPNLIFCFSLSI